MVELTRDEELAILEALNKRIKSRLDELKSETKYELIEAYAQDGTDRRSIRANGANVGKVSMKFSKAKPVIRAGMNAEALDALECLGLVDYVPSKGWEKHFTHVGDNVYCDLTGELVDWAEWQQELPISAMITGCKPEDVLEALQTKLQGQNLIGLLEE